MGRKKELSASGERSVFYQRARWKHWVRYFGVTVIVLLNCSLIMSTIELHQMEKPPELGREIASFVLVLFFDATVLLPVLLEVDTIWITPDHITLKALFWKGRISWKDIVSFQNPIWLTYAIVRTKKGVYLLNRRDLKPWDELMEVIQFKRIKEAQ